MKKIKRQVTIALVTALTGFGLIAPSLVANAEGIPPETPSEKQTDKQTAGLSDGNRKNPSASNKLVNKTSTTHKTTKATAKHASSKEGVKKIYWNKKVTPKKVRLHGAKYNVYTNRHLTRANHKAANLSKYTFTVSRHEKVLTSRNTKALYYYVHVGHFTGWVWHGATKAAK